MRKAIATIGIGAMAPVLRITEPRMRGFARRHGYEVVVGDGDSGTRPAAWGKVLLLRELVQRYDRVLWVDSDVLVLDDTDDLPPLEDGMLQAMVEPPDAHDGVIVNSGVWLLRGGPDAVELLDAVWANDARVNHAWWEQAALLDLLGYEITEGPVPRGWPGEPTQYRRQTQLLDPSWNTMSRTGNWPQEGRLPDLDGVRMLHFAGHSNYDRVRVMLAVLRRADLKYAARHWPRAQLFMAARRVRARFRSR